MANKQACYFLICFARFYNKFLFTFKMSTENVCSHIEQKSVEDIKFTEEERDHGSRNQSNENAVCRNEEENKGNQIVAAVDITKEPTPEFYGKAQKYWEKVPATVNGMLGGLGYVSTIDIHGSRMFLRELKLPQKNYALDCGAGIGRVTKNLLMPIFAHVDLVEQDPTFAEKAQEFCTAGCEATECYADRLGKIFNVGLQEFEPVSQRYDLVWSQWVLGHLTDADLIVFFRRIKTGLAAKGIFVMKENVTSSKRVEIDEEDSSVTRPLIMYEKLLKEAGFKIIRSLRQQSFPKGLFPVYMIACRPQLTEK